jgi:hypothetical protein
MRNILILVFFIFTSTSSWASAYTTVAINTKTSDSVINIQYPQGFEDQHINLTIQAFIDHLKKPFVTNAPLQEFPESEWYQEYDSDFINVEYKVKFNTPHVVSILFDIIIYGKGAAHPNGSLKTLTIIDGHKEQLTQLFKSNSNYLSIISNYCYKRLLKELSLERVEEGFSEEDKKLLKKGTRPVIGNYKKWYFNKKGLVIVFEGLQVIGVENGPVFFVTIPYQTLKSWACTKKDDVIWGDV